MTEPTKAKWDELRKPFPKGVYGLLPKPYKKDSPKGKCNDCGGYHGLPAVHLDFVGHAAVTDRLNSVVGPDGWSLEPMAFDEFGNPVTNRNGELWCWLTIMGIKKMCVGDGSISSKELIGDALRNGAMRFGVALDLWTKDELESHVDDPELKSEKPSKNQSATASPAPSAPTSKQMFKIRQQMVELKFDEKTRDSLLAQLSTTKQASHMIEDLQKRIDKRKEESGETN